MDANLTDVMELAFKATLLLDKDFSERGAVLRVIEEEPDLSIVFSEGLKLVLDTLRERSLLDVIISRILDGIKAGAKTRSLLRLATYLLLRVDDFESLERIKRGVRNLGSVSDLGSVEILIGTVSTVELNSLVSGVHDVERIAIETQYPEWWVHYCIRAFGRSEAVNLLSASPRPRYVRVNPLKNGGRTTVPTQLKPSSSKLSKVSARLPIYYLNSSPARFSQFFSEGLLQVQDLASFLAVKAAEPRPGETVLDLCAAPGGKTATLAQFMKNRGMIVSVDYSQSRMRSWKSEVSRLGVEIAEPVICAAQDLSLHQEFDLVLIDPPCTGTGILDRNPRMKWRLTPELLNRYSDLQTKFLNSAASVVAKGGRILYCTCSVTLEENEQVLRSFLKTHSEFEIQPILNEYGKPGLVGFEGSRRFWPHRDRTAGYFVARLESVS